MKKILLVLLTVPFFAACENVDLDMWDQVTYKTQEYPRFTNPEGAIPYYGWQKKYDEVDGVTIATGDAFYADGAAAKGKKLYNIYCAPCHGANGDGNTPVGKKLDKKPADLKKASVKVLTEGELFKRILTENSSMPGHRNEITDDEAWGIVAHIRELQGKK